MAFGATQIILEENYDEGFVPTEKEVREYAIEIGIDPDTEPELMTFAREGIMTPLPPEWRPCKDTTGEIYYFNFSTGKSIWEHPCDEHYRKLVTAERECIALLAEGRKKKKKKNNQGTDNKKKKKKKKKDVETRGIGTGILGPIRGLVPVRIPGGVHAVDPRLTSSLRSVPHEPNGLPPRGSPDSIGGCGDPLVSSLFRRASNQERDSREMHGVVDWDEGYSLGRRESENRLKDLHLDFGMLGSDFEYEESLRSEDVENVRLFDISDKDNVSSREKFSVGSRYTKCKERGEEKEEKAEITLNTEMNDDEERNILSLKDDISWSNELTGLTNFQENLLLGDISLMKLRYQECELEEMTQIEKECEEMENEESEHAEREQKDKERVEMELKERECTEKEHTVKLIAQKEYEEREHGERKCAEKDRVEREQKEKECVEREQKERERAAREQRERKRAEKEQWERERAEREKKEREHAEREQKERERAERKQKEREHAEREQKERERTEREQKERECAEREQKERERAEREQKERERAEREQKERERAERVQKERERAEREQKESECAEREQKERECAERKQKERECAERKQKEREHAEREQKEREHAERELKERECAEREQKERECAEMEQKERECAQMEQKERECVEMEQKEREHTEREQKERECAEREQQERECLERGQKERGNKEREQKWAVYKENDAERDHAETEQQEGEERERECSEKECKDIPEKEREHTEMKQKEDKQNESEEMLNKELERKTVNIERLSKIKTRQEVAEALEAGHVIKQHVDLIHTTSDEEERENGVHIDMSSFSHSHQLQSYERQLEDVLRMRRDMLQREHERKMKVLRAAHARATRDLQWQFDKERALRESLSAILHAEHVCSDNGHRKALINNQRDTHQDKNSQCVYQNGLTAPQLQEKILRIEQEKVECLLPELSSSEGLLQAQEETLQRRKEKLLEEQKSCWKQRETLEPKFAYTRGIGRQESETEKDFKREELMERGLEIVRQKQIGESKKVEEANEERELREEWMMVGGKELNGRDNVKTPSNGFGTMRKTVRIRDFEDGDGDMFSVESELDEEEMITNKYIKGGDNSEIPKNDEMMDPHEMEKSDQPLRTEDLRSSIKKVPRHSPWTHVHKPDIPSVSAGFVANLCQYPVHEDPSLQVAREFLAARARMQKKERMVKRYKSDENLRCEEGRAGYFDDEDIRYWTHSGDFRRAADARGVLQDQVMEKVQRGAKQQPEEEQLMKNVTFDNSTDEGSEYDSESEYDFISSAVPSRLPSLLQQLSVELRAVLAALPTLPTSSGYIYQPIGGNPPYGPTRVSPNHIPTEPGVPISTFVSNPNISTASQSLTNHLSRRWSHYFPAGLPPTASGDIGGLASYLGYIPASERVSTFHRRTSASSPQMGMVAENHRQWLHDFRKRPSLPSTTQPARSPHGYLELRLDESNQIRVYHH
uniref:centrosomal protein of 164 kDa isoform X2 n=1 Tax=Myxine glutinosa TaxID=7769 RepID=UPI00358E975C